jgi:hypothetical protein
VWRSWIDGYGRLAKFSPQHFREQLVREKLAGGICSGRGRLSATMDRERTGRGGPAGECNEERSRYRESSHAATIAAGRPNRDQRSFKNLLANGAS